MMKLLKNDNNLIVFFNKKKQINFNDSEETESFLKDLILILNKTYNIRIDGYYDAKIHVDRNYGCIIELKKETLEYFDYYETSVELNFKVYNEKFVYEIENYNYFDQKHNFYKLKEKLYLDLEKINAIELGRILEYSKIIYGKKAEEIRQLKERVL